MAWIKEETKAIKDLLTGILLNSVAVPSRIWLPDVDFKNLEYPCILIKYLRYEVNMDQAQYMWHDLEEPVSATPLVNKRHYPIPCWLYFQIDAVTSGDLAQTDRDVLMSKVKQETSLRSVVSVTKTLVTGGTEVQPRLFYFVDMAQLDQPVDNKRVCRTSFTYKIESYVDYEAYTTERQVDEVVITASPIEEMEDEA
jgi:hypothetical protein